MLIRLIFVFSLFLLGCEEEKASVVNYIRSVKTEPLREVSSLRVRQISGVVTASSESKISFRIPGRVNEVNVRSGDFVSKGKILATLEQSKYELSVVSAEAKLSGAVASYREKEKNLSRQKILRKQDYVSQAVAEQAEADFMTTKSNVAIAKSALQIAQNDLANAVLRAPFSGRIVSRNIAPFTEITVSSVAFVLQNQDFYSVEVLVPETFIHSIDYDDIVNISFPTLPGKTVSGHVSQISAKAESGNAFLVKVDLSKSSLSILAGLTARVAFSFGRNSALSASSGTNVSSYLIPVSALDLRIEELAKTSDKKIGVFIFNEEKQIVETRKVRVIALRGNHFEVIGNLKEGELLITAGISFIKDGQKVKKFQPQYNVPAKIKF